MADTNSFEEIKSILYELGTKVEKLEDTITRTNPLRNEPHEVGGMELAREITGLSDPTIYRLVSHREIPHSKRNKRLYFKRSELLEWIDSGKRKTRQEVANEVQDNFSKKKRGVK